ncbi:MAG: FAD-binding protein [Candidatus Bathyarchaeota archaeon]|nr:FAD-binding protein [Candidatus Bathyarchaeota archaeon]
MTTYYEADVLIIGSGGAGLRAAIEAEARGANVLIVSKAATGMKNATIVANGSFRAAIDGYTVEEHRQATMEGGKHLNDPALVDVLVSEGAERLLELRKYGVVITTRYGNVLCGDNPEARGLGFIQPMVKYLKERGVKLVDKCTITELIKEKDRVIGAVGLRDEPVVFKAGATILAAGGSAGAYSRTDCPVDIAGDGYALAYEAGATLRDMEFIQFAPVAVAEEGYPAFAIYGDLVDKGTLLNSLGEDIVEKHGITQRPLTTMARDHLSRAIMSEVHEGRGVDGAVLLDASDVINEVGIENLYAKDSQRKVLMDMRADEKPFKVTPVTHFTMAGVEIRPDCSTNVPGLYAVGEVTGGVHGANRLGGNALTEIVVFGARAGASAAEYAAKHTRPEIDYDFKGTYTTETDPAETLKELRILMWYNVGIVRSKESLTQALNRLHEMSKLRFNEETISHQKQAAETRMAIMASTLTTLSALRREESRGTHYRVDFPDMNPEWLKPIRVYRTPDGPSLEDTV